MNKLISALIFLVLFFLLFPQNAFATIMSIYPSDDTDASMLNPDTNTGSQPRIAIMKENKQNMAGPIKYIWPYFKFNLSSLVSGTKINKAILKVTRCDSDRLAEAIRLDFYRLTSDWQEGTVTSNKRPEASMPRAADPANYLTNQDIQEWDVTQYTRDWVEGFYPNYGITLMYRSGTSGPRAWFCSKEATSVGTRPQLVVNYVPIVTPTPAVNKLPRIGGNINLSSSLISRIKDVLPSIKLPGSSGETSTANTPSPTPQQEAVEGSPEPSVSQPSEVIPTTEAVVQPTVVATTDALAQSEGKTEVVSPASDADVLSREIKSLVADNTVRMVVGGVILVLLLKLFVIH